MLFSKKQIPVISAEQQQVVEKKKQEEIARTDAMFEWIQSKSISEISAIFTELLEEPIALSSNPKNLNKDDQPAYYAALDKIETIARMWAQIDKQKLTREQAATMYVCLNEKLPRILKEYVTLANRNSIGWAYETYQLDTPTKKGLAGIVETLYGIKLSQKIPTLPLDIKPTQDIVVGTTKAFPKFSTNSLVLNAELTHLEEIWLFASSKKNSVEDEYFLEEIASNYLPEAWKMYSTFKLANQDYARKAEEIIIEQVSLFTTKVQSILDVSFDAALVALGAQTEFLKVKLEEDETTSIHAF